MKPIKLFEMFAGYGGASFALKKAGVPHEIVGYSEIDKFAIECYDQNHFYTFTKTVDGKLVNGWDINLVSKIFKQMLLTK